MELEDDYDLYTRCRVSLSFPSWKTDYIPS
jgi:hypothetical protein